jgi:hypothetical protein
VKKKDNLKKRSHLQSALTAATEAGLVVPAAMPKLSSFKTLNDVFTMFHNGCSSPFVVTPMKPIVGFFHSTQGLNVGMLWCRGPPLIRVGAKTGRPGTAYYNTLIFLRAFDQHCNAIAAKSGGSVVVVLAALEKERTDAGLSVTHVSVRCDLHVPGAKLGQRACVIVQAVCI